jgi:hypothetical protein
MTEELYNFAYDQATRVGKLLGTIGAIVKYDNSDLPNHYFKSLAKVYLEINTCELDREAVMAQADKRGVTLS